MYALHLLFLALVFLVLTRLEKSFSRPVFFLLAYIAALSFSNHLQTVLLFPTLLLFLLARRRIWGIGFNELGYAVIFFGLGLSIYLYLPIRSSVQLLADWGATSHFDNLIRHISGWQYRVWMFHLSPSQVWDNFISASKIIAGQFHPLFFLFVLVGLLLPKNLNKTFFRGILLLAAVTIFYNINYDINDIDGYYLPAVFALYLFGGIGALSVLSFTDRLKGKGVYARAGLSSLLLFLAVYPTVRGWRRADHIKNRFAQEAVENIYQSAPAGGLVFTALWDHNAPWCYNHFVLGRRPDLIMLDISLSRYSWYLDFLKQAYPELVAGSETKIDSAKVLIRDFEKGRPYSSAVIEAAYQSMLTSILRQNLQKRPVYLDVATRFDSASSWFSIPEGVLFRLYARLDYYPFVRPELGFKEVENPIFLDDPIIRREVETLNRMLTLRQNYEAAAARLKSDGGYKENRP